MKPNLAQRIMIACGADHLMVTLGHLKRIEPHPTKRGPGRRHNDGSLDADRRKDKLMAFEAVVDGEQVVAYRDYPYGESKIQRCARLKQIGVRK